MLPKLSRQCFFYLKRLLTKTTYKYSIRIYHYDIDNLPAVNVSGIKNSFKALGSIILDGHSCIVVNTILCEEAKKVCKLYVNKTTGFFMCENCTRAGSWKTLDNFIQFKKTKNPIDGLKFQKSLEYLPDFNQEWNKLKFSCKPIQNIPNDMYLNIMQQFNLKDVPQEIMTQMNVLYEHSSQSIYFPLTSFNNLIVGYKSISTTSCIEKTVPLRSASGVIFYKQKNIKLDGTAVLVPNIEDLLVIAKHKAASIIICLPYGLQNIPQEILPYLEFYEKLVLWFRNDEASWDSSRHFAKKLNDSRCYFVRQTDYQPPPRIASNLGYNLKDIIKNAQPIWHKFITTFHSLRQDVLSDLQNIDKVQGVKWKRYPTLNKILRGHRRGEFTVLTGPTGCGKTTFMSEYSLDLAMQGVNTLWGSFEIRNSRLAKTMLQQMSGVPLEDNLDKFDLYANEFEKLPIFFMTFHGQQNFKVVMEAVEHATYVHDIAHVIIDNVQFMMGVSDEGKHMDRFWKQDHIVSSFRTFATKFNCHVSLVIHPRKERDNEELTTSSIFGGAKATQEADNILIVQDKRLTSIRGKKYLQVAKNRYSGDLGIMVLDFDKDSLSYAPKKKSKSDAPEVNIVDL